MRIPFKHKGQADQYLKICRELVEKAVAIELPKMRAYHAFCKGFGYTNYEELVRLVSATSCFSGDMPGEQIKSSLANGFRRALDLARELGVEEAETVKAISPQLAEVAHQLARQVNAPQQERQRRVVDNQALARDREARELLNDATVLLVNNAFTATELSDAEAKLKRVVSISPDNPEPYNWLGLIECRRGDYAKAVSYYQQAVELASTRMGDRDPRSLGFLARMANDDYYAALVGLGKARWQVGERKLGIETLERALTKDRSDSDVRELLAQMYHLEGNLSRARQMYIRNRPQSAAFVGAGHHYNFGLLHFQKRKYEEALLIIRFAFLQNPYIAYALLHESPKELQYVCLPYNERPAVPAEVQELWTAVPNALQLLKELTIHPSVLSDFKQIATIDEWLGRCKGQFAMKTPFLEERTRLCSWTRLEETNGPIANEVMAKARSACIIKEPRAGQMTTLVPVGAIRP